jgi:hypothetical protein
MVVTEEIKVEAKAMQQRGTSLADIMQHLRNQGVSLLGTIAVVHRLLPVRSLADAKELVLNSVAWVDHKESFYEFQNMFWDALEEGNEGKDESAKPV